MIDPLFYLVTAQYPGRCSCCEGRWSVGDGIKAKVVAAGEKLVWVHQTCPDDPDAMSPIHPVCPHCWLTHPEGECER